MNIFDKSLIPSCKILTSLISKDQDETYHKIFSCYHKHKSRSKISQNIYSRQIFHAQPTNPAYHKKEEIRPCVTKECH
jgi:hypothetical protein